MSTEVHPSVEDIAAFLDRRLSREERARVAAHLADCGDCYELFAESLQFQIDEGEEGEDEEIKDPEDEPDDDPFPVAPGSLAPVLHFPETPAPLAPVTPFPRREVVRWVAAAAAMFTIGVVAVPLYLRSASMPELSTAAMVASKVAGDERVRADGFWSQWTKRGAGDEGSGLVSNAHETLLGAHAVDLSISLHNNDRGKALDDLASINGHVGELLFRDEVRLAYVEIQGRIDKGEPPATFLHTAEQIEAKLPVEEAPYFALGRWAEAGRLSAVAESPDFFLDRKNQKFLKAFLRQVKEENPDDTEAITLLEKVQATLGDLEPSALPYSQLREQLGAILTHYQEQVESDSGV